LKEDIMLRTRPLTFFVALAIAAGLPLHAQAPAGRTLARIADAGRIKFGYRADARPFSYSEQSGNPGGYSVALCQQIANAVKTRLRKSNLAVDWVPVTAQDRYGALQGGTIDLLCGADTITLERRASVAFSLPIFPGGTGVMLRSDAPVRLKDVLSGKGQTFRPTWRAQASDVLRSRGFAAVSGTTSEKWLGQRIKDLQVVSVVLPVPSYDAGLDAVLGRRADALFGERAILLDAARRNGAKDLMVLDRLFTYEPLALAMAPNDDEFRLLVDRTLSRFYASGELGGLYTIWFGEPDESAFTFFRWNTIQE
jgi:polar amino acid transport system substrate-binding protein